MAYPKKLGTRRGGKMHIKAGTPVFFLMPKGLYCKSFMYIQINTSREKYSLNHTTDSPDSQVLEFIKFDNIGFRG